MTDYQTNFNTYTAYLLQSGVGVPASGAGATILRQTGGTPGKLSKTAISSKEVRRDAQQTRGRHGQQTTAGGPYTLEVSVGSVDPIYQALLRGTWDSEISLAAADFTSLSYGANSIVFASGSPIGKGLRVNDVIELSVAEDVGNTLRNIRIAGLSSTTITTVEPMTVNAAADTTAVLKRRGRKVIMPAAGSLVNRYFSVEEMELDMGASEFYSDCFWKSGKFSMTPNGIITFEPSWMGTGAMEVEESGTAPILTSPTLPIGAPMAVLDAKLRYKGEDIADLTSWDLTIDNGAVAPATAASRVSPTVLPGLNQVSMNLTVLRKDMSDISAFLGETGVSLSVLAVDQSADPKNFLSINVPFFTLGSADKSALSTAGGARTTTISIPAALVGHDTTGAGYDDTMMSIQISNVS